jgi:trimethylamine:corrinoid methyltransferase-like protein
VTEGKLAARRGRELRRAARSQGDLVKLGAIHRRIPAVELLHSEALEII